MKWGSPFFMHQGKILCFMAAFKAHLAFGFWGPAMKKVLAADGHRKDGRGLLGRITSRADLPADKVLIGYIRTARELHDSGLAARPRRKSKPEVPIPDDLAAALRKNRSASVRWAAFSPGARRDYIEWITGAKRPETRATRLATTLSWVAAGKKHNWRYANC
jgi:uncharacterized protein YdeI (YjbR/CyaY-like superfamily)